MTLRHGNGFTLTELMVAVLLLALLSAAVLPRLVRLLARSREAATRGALGELRSALAVYYTDHGGRFPVDDLSCLTVNGKYAKRIPPAWAPPRHAPSAAVDTNDNLGLTAILTADDGRWKYWNWRTMSGGGRRWGSVWVGCTHADTGQKVWSTF
jgi:prepilin-type N-terminal cleavage/methylation domain-containing protein